VLGMAIKFDYTDKAGVVHVGAIARVSRVRTSTSGITGILLIHDAIDPTGSPIDKITVDMPFTTTVTGTKNFVKRAYEAILAEGVFPNPTNI